MRRTGTAVSLAIAVLAMISLSLGCGRTTVGREDWLQMKDSDKILYIQAMIGAERAKSAKGGNANSWSAPATHYVRAIDNAYARGELRDPHSIFEELADRRIAPDGLIR
jgi:predicted Fe-S protein YdhL (DUF1289 family)